MSGDDLPQELGALARRLEALPDEAWSPPEPPPLRLPAEPRQATLGLGRWLRERVTLRAPVAVAASLVLVALGVGIGRIADPGGDGPPAGRIVTLAPLGTADPGASATARIGKDRVVLQIRGLRPSSEGRHYEAWLLNSPTDLLTLGAFTIRPDGSAVVEMPVPEGAERFAAIDISLEPLDGNPRHSGDSVLRATI